MTEYGQHLIIESYTDGERNARYTIGVADADNPDHPAFGMTADIHVGRAPFGQEGWKITVGQSSVGATDPDIALLRMGAYLEATRLARLAQIVALADAALDNLDATITDQFDPHIIDRLRKAL